MTKPDLKPCPFCGGEADIEELAGGMGDCAFSVGCQKEHCFGYQSYARFSLRSDAIKAWNIRLYRQAGYEILTTLPSEIKHIKETSEGLVVTTLGGQYIVHGNGDYEEMPPGGEPEG